MLECTRHALTVDVKDRVEALYRIYSAHNLARTAAEGGINSVEGWKRWFRHQKEGGLKRTSTSTSSDPARAIRHRSSLTPAEGACEVADEGADLPQERQTNDEDDLAITKKAIDSGIIKDVLADRGDVVPTFKTTKSAAPR